MRLRRLMFLVPLLLLMAAILAACSEPTPTPTPSPTPSPTPTPEATPTPTPTLTPEQAIQRARQAVVKLTSGSVSWNGVMVGDGLILTSSRQLGQAPVADFTTEDGRSGQAWVVGRDDDMALALLRVVGGAQGLNHLDVEPVTVPTIDADLILLQFSANSVDVRNARVLQVRQHAGTGIRYVQVQAAPGSSGDGALLIDQAGRVQGIRMPEGHMTRIGLGVAGEVYGMAAESIANFVLPHLQSGVLSLRQDEGTGTPTAPADPPPLPAVFRGNVTFEGAPLAVDERVYVRLSQSGRPDLWFSAKVTTEGRYNIAVAPLASGYANGTIEFWVNAKKAAQTDTFRAGSNTEVNLTFE